MLHIESDLQINCVRYFRYQYPQFAMLCFAVPNGGARSRRTGAILKAEGVVAGVADLLILIPSGKYHGICIEFKTAKGRQSPAQKEWQKAVEKQGYIYAVVRTIDEFVEIIKQYLTL